MSYEFVRTLAAVAALFANVATVGLVVVLVAARRSLAARRFVNVVGDSALWLGGLVALAATAGSLYFSEVADLIPCRYCWFQRIAMYPLALVLLIGASFRDRNVRRYAVALAGIGICVSTYHYLLEQGVITENNSSCDPLAPCAAPYFWEFDFITLAYMAASAFALILTLMATTWVRHGAAEPRQRELAEAEPSLSTRSDARVPDARVEEPVP